MTQQPQLTPEMVYSIVSQNPNLQNLVSQTVHLNTLRQQAQTAQQNLINGMSNPYVGYNPYVQSQIPQQQLPQQVSSQPPVNVPQNAENIQPIQQPQQAVQNQGGQQLMSIPGIPNIQEIISQVQGVIQNFENSFSVLNNNVKELYSKLISMEAKVDALSKEMGVEIKPKALEEVSEITSIKPVVSQEENKNKGE